VAQAATNEEEPAPTVLTEAPPADEKANKGKSASCNRRAKLRSANRVGTAPASSFGALKAASAFKKKAPTEDIGELGALDAF
jgi:hypothetical protein